MPRGFAAALAVTAWATAAQVPAEASAHPSARFLIDRRGAGGAGGASEAEPASFVQASNSKNEPPKKSPVKSKADALNNLVERQARKEAKALSKFQENSAAKKKADALKMLGAIQDAIPASIREVEANRSYFSIPEYSAQPSIGEDWQTFWDKWRKESGDAWKGPFEHEHEELRRFQHGPTLDAEDPDAAEARERGECARVSGRRVVSVADLHGDWVAMLQLLQSLRLVSRNVTWSPKTWRNMWVGGTAMFVQTGDVLDRGLEGQRMLKFLWALQDEQPDNVVLLLGNHETWMFTQEYRLEQAAVLPKDLCTYTKDFDKCIGAPQQMHQDQQKDNVCFMSPPQLGLATSSECFARAWSGFGWMGSHMLARLKSRQVKIAHMVSDTLFVHAGVSPEMLERLRPDSPDGAPSRDQYLDAMTARAAWTIQEGRYMDWIIDAKWGRNVESPVWTRFFGHRQNLTKYCARVNQVLATLGASRMVKGHDPNRDQQGNGQAAVLCEGRLIIADTFMSIGYTQGYANSHAAARAKSQRNLMVLETSTEGRDIRIVYPFRDDTSWCMPLTAGGGVL